MIRTTDREGIVGIIARGKPAGQWIARIQRNPDFWTGADANGQKAAIRNGTFAEVLEWLQRRADIKQDRTRDRIIRDTQDSFYGLRVTAEGAVRIPEAEMKRAKEYSGFGMHSVKKNVGPKKVNHDGLRHGNEGKRRAAAGKNAEIDEQILALSREGLLQTEIARRLGQNRKFVQHRVALMRERGIEVPDVYRDRLEARRREKIAIIRRMWINEGLTQVEIARRLGMTTSAVGMLVQRIRRGE